MKQTVLAVVMAAALGVGALAQGAATKALPLDNLGLEHLDIIVPDPAASARFYSRIFKSALHQQPVRDTLRYFVLLGDPSPLQAERDGLLSPRGVDHMLLRVSSLEMALPYYRMVYGAAAERPRDANGRVWFHLARNTRLGLEEAAPGQTPNGIVLEGRAAS